MHTLEDLKARLTAVIDGYKEYKQQTTNTPPTNCQPSANNGNIVTASSTLSGSVGEGGTNKPGDVALVKTLINKFIKAFDLNDNADLGKIGATTIKVIKQFQTHKVGLANPDGRIDVGGKSWKILNGEMQPNDSNPITVSKTLSASVGEGGTNKPGDVALVKTLINKFIKAFDLNNRANLGKAGATTIEVIKKFQKEKVGLTNPDGRIDVGGNSWKVLNGETQLTAEAALQTNSASGYNAALGQELAKRARSVANSMRTVGRCYAGTCQAVNGFIGKPILHGMSAYMAARLLAAQPKLFKEISASSTTLTSLPVGTIVVWSRGKARRQGVPVTQPHPQHGHIMICLGGGKEASDHVTRIIFQGCGVSCRAFIPISKR